MTTEPCGSVTDRQLSHTSAGGLAGKSIRPRNSPNLRGSVYDESTHVILSMRASQVGTRRSQVGVLQGAPIVPKNIRLLRRTVVSNNLPLLHDEEDLLDLSNVLSRIAGEGNDVRQRGLVGPGRATLRTRSPLSGASSLSQTLRDASDSSRPRSQSPAIPFG